MTDTAPLSLVPPAGAPPVRDPQEEARARARACGQEIADVLAKHNCRIAPFLLPLEPVGHDGARALVQASYGIIPNPS